MAKKPLFPSEGALLLKRRKAGATRNGNEAPGGEEIGTDPHGGIEKKDNDPQRGEGMSVTAWDHLSPSCSSSIHLGNSPPMTASVSQILREVQNEKFMRWPSQMRIDPAKRDNTKYCEFHRDHGHRTDNCIQLRKEIEYLIRRGHLRLYVASEGQDQVQPPPPCQPTQLGTNSPWERSM